MNKIKFILISALVIFCSINTCAASRSGKRALLIQDYSRALDIFHKDIGKKPNDWEAHSLIGFIYLQEGFKDKAKALFHLEKAFEINKKDQKTSLYLFMCYVDEEKYGNAQGILSFIDKKQIDKLEEKHLFYLYQGLLYSGRGETAEAIDMIIEAIRLEPACGICRKHLGMIYYRNEDYANADAVLSRAVGFFPDDYEINYALADIFLTEDYFRPGSAKLHIEKLKSENKPDIMTLILEAKFFLMTGEPKQSLEAYKKAYDMDEQNCEVNIGLADLYQKKETRNLNLSKKHLNTVMEKCHGHDNLHLLLGNYYYNTSDHRKAVSEYEMHLSNNPEDASAMVKLGLVFLQKPYNDPSKTITLGLKALEINKSYLPALKLLSTAYFMGNDHNNAKNYILKTLELSPNDSELLGYMAEISFNDKDYSSAKSYGQKAFRINSNNLRALRILGEIAYTEKDYQKAAQYLENVIRLKRNDYRASLLLGYIFQEPGFTDYRKSSHYAQIALEQNKSDANTWKLLGNAYLKDRMLSKALDAFKNSLLYNPNDSWVKSQVEDLKRRLGTD